MQRSVERLQHSFRPEEAAFDDAAEMPVLIRPGLARREVDARELEEGDVLVARVDVAPRRLHEAPQERGAEHGLLGRERRREP